MKQLLLTLILASSLHADTKLYINSAVCEEVQNQSALKQKFGFQPKSVFKGQTKNDGPAMVYSDRECAKENKGYFNCTVVRHPLTYEKENLVDYKLYTGKCL